MNAITRQQPSAMLIALGVQTLFTTSRPAPKGIVGERVAVHAGKRLIQAPECPFPAWVALYQAQMRSGEGCRRCGHPDSQHVCHFSKTVCLGCGCDSWRAPDLPLGAVVASCIVTDVVPVVGAYGQALTSRFVRRSADNFATLVSVTDGVRSTVGIGDQLPYADFAPGRWAWLLSDVAPTDVRCPTCWGTGIFGGAGSYYDAPGRGKPCRTCGGAGHCPPIPATGRPGLWRWKT